MTCAIIPFGKAALPATSHHHRKNRAAGVPVAIANQASPLEASEGLIAPAGRRPPSPAHRHLGPDDPAGARAPLAEELVRIAPEGFGHAVLVGSHADAIDLAAGLCRAYHRARGEPERTGIVARDGDGTTLSPIARLRHTGLSENRFTRGQPAEGKTRAEDLRRAVSRSGAGIAACLVEPLAVNAGVLVPPQGYLDCLRAICDTNGLLLVFDEASGFGHTGTAFAGQSLGVVPDVIVLGATIANGAHSCGAVLVRRRDRRDDPEVAGGRADPARRRRRAARGQRRGRHDARSVSARTAVPACRTARSGLPRRRILVERPRRDRRHPRLRHAGGNRFRADPECRRSRARDAGAARGRGNRRRDPR